MLTVLLTFTYNHVNSERIFLQADLSSKPFQLQIKIVCINFNQAKLRMVIIPCKQI